jgi:hypothetical protein
MREVPSLGLGRILLAMAGYMLLFPPAHKANDGIVPRQCLERLLKILFQVIAASLNEHQKINYRKNLLEPLH